MFICKEQLAPLKLSCASAFPILIMLATYETTDNPFLTWIIQAMID
jgi:hypothetical protein